MLSPPGRGAYSILAGQPRYTEPVQRLKGILGAFALCAASFALHIIGGATDQFWLFALAVALIYFTAAGFPAIAWLLAGKPGVDRVLLTTAGATGLVLTVAALRAANDRTFEWWQVPLGVAAVALTSAAIVGVLRFRRVFVPAGPPTETGGRRSVRHR